MTASTATLRIIDRIGDIDGTAWNALGAAPYPFLRHEFLTALEEEDCLGERFGWLPRHLTLWDAEHRLVAAAPLYLKFNSYGEFVFDWAWADAYARNGMRYYPKLVSASPYTPATGPKLLVAAQAPTQSRQLLLSAALELATQAKASSLHWLFTTAAETDLLEQAGLVRRIGCQFH
ncbi:MAG: N-acetyltransferase, partial [Gammaproteobacteria bacterium]|nr:N-acetyltransferase [Gammaproteobacteria bacterium]